MELVLLAGLTETSTIGNLTNRSTINNSGAMDDSKRFIIQSQVGNGREAGLSR